MPMTLLPDRGALEVAGEEVSGEEGFGWGNLYDVAAGGNATLSYQTPLPRFLASGAQAAAWLLLARVLLVARRRERPELRR